MREAASLSVETNQRVISYSVTEQDERIESATTVALAVFDWFEELGVSWRAGRTCPTPGSALASTICQMVGSEICRLVTRLRTRECLGVSGRLHAPGVRAIDFRSHCPRLDQPQLRRAEARGG